MRAFVRTTLSSISVAAISLVAISLVANSPAFAKVYKHVDEYGNVSYSDKPIEGASEVKIHNVKPSSSSSNDTGGEGEGEGDEESTGTTGESEAKAIKYRSLQVLTPRQGKVIDSETGDVQVIFLPTPSLGPNDEIVINVDGRDISKGRDVNLSVKNLPEGTHTVSGRIQSAEGKTIIESAKISFKLGT